MGAPLDLFVSCADQDAPRLLELVKHLAPLEKQGAIRVWHDGLVQAGESVEAARARAFEAARVVVALISADFLASTGHCAQDMELCLRRHREKTALVLQVIVRACDWANGPLTGLPVAPHNGKPVVHWPHPDDAWLDVVRALRALVPGLPADRGPVASANPTRPPFPRNGRFEGHEEDLARMHAALQGGGAGDARAVMLWGMGGIGKTQLAVEYAYRNAAAYPDGIFWLNATLDWRQELARLAMDAGLTASDATEVDRERKLILAFRRYLDAHRSALLVFDNVDDPGRLDRDRDLGFVPSSLGCRVLFTTRRSGTDLPFTRIEVRALQSSEAVRLLLGSDARRGALEKGPETEISAAQEICETVGRLPLAIALASAYLGRYRKISLEDYLERLIERGALPTLPQDGIDLPTSHEKGVQATLRLQWDALMEANGAGDSPSVLQTASLFEEAAPIPRARLAVFTGLSDQARNGEPAPLEVALALLDEMCLVLELEEEVVRLHPLVREFARGTIPDRAQLSRACGERVWVSLGDPLCLDGEVGSRGIGEVLGDLRSCMEIAPSPPVRREADHAPDAAFAAIEELLGALDLEAHKLTTWQPGEEPSAFLQQLRHRCFESGMDRMRRLAEEALDRRGLPSLQARLRQGRTSRGLLRTLDGRGGYIHGVAVTADGGVVVSASEDALVRVWRGPSGRLLRDLPGHARAVKGVAIAANGRMAATVSEDGTLRTWNLITRRLRRVIEVGAGPIEAVAVDEDGRLAIVGTSDGTVAVWDLENGQCVFSEKRHAGVVHGVALSPGGATAVSASADRTLLVGPVRGDAPPKALVGHEGAVRCVALSGDGRLAVSGGEDSTVVLWDLSEGTLRARLAGHTGAVLGVCFLDEAPRVASASRDGTIRIWEAGQEAPPAVLRGHAAWVSALAASRDGALLVSGSWDQTVKIWSVHESPDSGAAEGHEGWVSAVAMAGDGRVGASASADGTILVWDLVEGRSTRRLTGHPDRVLGVALSAAGDILLSASKDRSVIAWSPADGRRLCVLEGHTGAATSVAVVADGSVAVSASEDGTLRVWDLRGEKSLFTLEGHEAMVHCVAVTPDGRLALSGSRDETLILWDLATGEQIHSLQGHTESVLGVSMTSDGERAASVAEDGEILFWDLTSGEVIHTVGYHEDRTAGVSLTPDGERLVTASQDRTLRVWHPGSPHALLTFRADAPLRCCAVGADGKRMIAGDEIGGVHLLDWVRRRT